MYIIHTHLSLCCCCYCHFTCVLYIYSGGSPVSRLTFTLVFFLYPMDTHVCLLIITSLSFHMTILLRPAVVVVSDDKRHGLLLFYFPISQPKNGLTSRRRRKCCPAWQTMRQTTARNGQAKSRAAAQLHTVSAFSRISWSAQKSGETTQMNVEERRMELG